MVFERRKGDDDTSKNSIQYATSDDGAAWTAPAELYKATNAGKEAASPYIVNVNGNLVSTHSPDESIRLDKFGRTESLIRSC